MIPNIFHYICIRPMDFELYHYLAVYSSIKINNPDTVYIYVDEPPTDNMYWDTLIKNEKIVVEKIGVPIVYRGIEVRHPQYRADLIRLEKLIERGGIYMDIDNMAIKTIVPLLDKAELVLGSSGFDNDHFLLDNTLLPKIEGVAISNNIIMCEKGHPFLIEWLKQIPEYLDGTKVWASGGAVLPVDILTTQTFKKSIILYNWAKYFCAESFEVDNLFIFDENQIHRITETLDRYTIVFYQTMVYYKYLQKIDLTYMMENTNIFTLLFRPYLKHLDLINYSWGAYYHGQWEKLVMYSRTFIGLNNNTNISKDLGISLALCKYFEAYGLLMDNYDKKICAEKFAAILEDKYVTHDLKSWSQGNLNNILKDLDDTTSPTV